jgi:uncharacterized protein YndB with AHSA1/START domain
MTANNSLHFERFIPAPAEQVFRAFTHPTALRDWLCYYSSVEARKTGHIFLEWEDGYYAAGAFTIFDPPHNLAFTWDGFQEPGLMAVQIMLTDQEGGVQLALDHLGLGDGTHWEDTRRALEAQWMAALENLHSFLLDGIDLRYARRPRLGIYMNEFTPQIAEQKGFPVSEGVLLAGVAQGSGAQAAGLQDGDLLVSMNGVPLKEPQSFSGALKGLRAGDRPLVEFYRGVEKRSIPLELSSFPIPPLPESPAALAETVRKLNANVHQQISAVTEGLDESLAARQPQPGEWSVNELIGHFILTERDYQSWAADMLHDNETGDYLQFRPNMNERIAALVTRFGSRQALLDELALAQEETAALLAALPESFTTWRKHFYRRLVQWVTEITPGHLEDEHLEQFKAAIAAVSA